MGFITTDRNQTIMFGNSIDDFVEKESKVRYIIAVIEKLNLEKLYSRYSPQGADSYDPKIMLAIIFLSFTESVYSTRKIEEYCKKHMDFIYASCNLRPDHTTIARFIQKNLDLMKDFFTQIVVRAKEKGYVSFKEIAIDGSKLKSKSSKKKSYKEKSLEKYLEGIEKEISEYILLLDKETEEIKREEIKEEVKKLSAKKELIKERKKELIERKKEIKKEYRETHQINIAEPEAFMMDLGYGKGYAPGYNAQISVDMEEQIIGSCDVIEDRNDSQTFLKQHKNIEEVLGKSKKRKHVTDNGYFSLEQLEYIKEKKVDAYIYKNTYVRTVEEIKKACKITKQDFMYDKEKDCYKCPMGKELTFYCEENNKSFKGKRYRLEGCSKCQLAGVCLAKNNKSGAREIKRDHREYLAEEMKKKIGQEEAKILFHKRMTSVEPVFGNIKENMKFYRFRRIGLLKVNGEFALVCLSHNINKLFSIVSKTMLVFISYMGKWHQYFENWLAQLNFKQKIFNINTKLNFNQI